MFRKATLVAGALSLVLMVPVAHAAKGDMSISLAGGVAIPMGDFSKKVADGGAGASMGFTAGPSFDYMITDAVAIGVDHSKLRHLDLRPYRPARARRPDHPASRRARRA